ncbi:MAG: hypothetical protein J6Y85_02020 [Alphaproteobacteria bacterium]|nr:hypothetical protein [Alphaproteobacteria bacterium]
MKKWTIILLYSFLIFSFQAQAKNTDHVITDKEQKCKIHYLASTPKKMWSIKTDADCPNGWVEGFANVHLFDLFNTEVLAISGFFKQGYWLDQFTPLDSLISYGPLDEHTKAISFLLDTDPASNTQYLALFRSIQNKDRAYPAFSMCQPDAYFAIIHPQSEDFKNPAFQGRIFKKIRQEAHTLCPNVKRIIILGQTAIQSTYDNWVFHADMDLTTEQANLRYRQPLPNIKEEEPSELRTEESEPIVTITSSDKTHIHADYNPHASLVTKNTNTATETSTQLWDYTGYNYSAQDLALLAKITPQPIQGKAVMHITSVALDGTGLVDQPCPILLLHTPNLKPGWANVQGTFAIQDNELIVKPLTIQPCAQEWCHEK